MMFDDSMVAGGSNASMLNTSMKSEGGLSMLNTSRGEEVTSSPRSTNNNNWYLRKPLKVLKISRRKLVNLD